MSYSEELSTFIEKYPYKQMVVGKATFRYALAGLDNTPTLVYKDKRTIHIF